MEESVIFLHRTTTQHRNVQRVVAQVLGPDNIITPYNTTVPSPSTRLNISPRADFQLFQEHVDRALPVLRNQQTSRALENSRCLKGYNSHSTEQTVQISDTQILIPTW